jgi:hypothetical protein
VLAYTMSAYPAARFPLIRSMARGFVRSVCCMLSSTERFYLMSRYSLSKWFEEVVGNEEAEDDGAEE